jgi:hypothetical protein
VHFYHDGYVLIMRSNMGLHVYSKVWFIFGVSLLFTSHSNEFSDCLTFRCVAAPRTNI